MSMVPFLGYRSMPDLRDYMMPGHMSPYMPGGGMHHMPGGMCGYHGYPGGGGFGPYGGGFDPYMMSQYMDPCEYQERMRDMMEMEHITPVQYNQYIMMVGHPYRRRSRWWPSSRRHQWADSLRGGGIFGGGLHNGPYYGRGWGP